jgi:hypothetical protein
MNDAPWAQIETVLDDLAIYLRESSVPKVSTSTETGCATPIT